MSAASALARVGMERAGRAALAAAAALGLLSAAGCSSGPVPEATKNRVFYQNDTFTRTNLNVLEQRYPPLDLAAQPPSPEYVGVSVLRGAVHLSRPTNWVIRAAGSTAGRRYIEYVSPNEYMVSIYELVDSPSDRWREVMGRYEDQADKDGAELLGKRVPIATGNAQGRAYVVRRRVPAAKAPFENFSNEYLIRSAHRILLVQIIHHDEPMSPIGPELRRTVETLEVY